MAGTASSRYRQVADLRRMDLDLPRSTSRCNAEFTLAAICRRSRPAAYRQANDIAAIYVPTVEGDRKTVSNGESMFSLSEPRGCRVHYRGGKVPFATARPPSKTSQLWRP